MKQTKEFSVTANLSGVGEVTLCGKTDFYPDAVDKINAGENPEAVQAWVQETYGPEEMPITSYDLDNSGVDGNVDPNFVQMLEQIHPEFGEKLIIPLLQNVGINDAGIANMKGE